MTTVYTPDDAMNDFLYIEAVLGDKERPEGGTTDLVCNRLEDYLMSLKVPESVPADRWCIGCLNHYDVAGADECLSADAPDIDEAKRSQGECPWFVPMVVQS